MISLQTNYLGMTLRTPLVVSISQLLFAYAQATVPMVTLMVVVPP